LLEGKVAFDIIYSVFFCMGDFIGWGGGGNVNVGVADIGISLVFRSMSRLAS
jgi:hypothetical protein